jgi:hypothetical protein
MHTVAHCAYIYYANSGSLRLYLLCKQWLTALIFTMQTVVLTTIGSLLSVRFLSLFYRYKLVNSGSFSHPFLAINGQLQLLIVTTTAVSCNILSSTTMQPYNNWAMLPSIPCNQRATLPSVPCNHWISDSSIHLAINGFCNLVVK